MYMTELVIVQMHLQCQYSAVQFVPPQFRGSKICFYEVAGVGTAEVVSIQIRCQSTLLVLVLA